MRVYALTTILFCLPAMLLADEPKNLLKPINDVESWRLELKDTGVATEEVAEEGIKFTVTEVDGTDWHVQAFQTDLDLQEGAQYTLKFKAM